MNLTNQYRFNMKNKINLLELFSGIGGFTLGLQQSGFEIGNHYFSEIDKHAIAVYKHNFKKAKHVGSVTDVSGRGINPDIITFGSPCQDFSLAGKRTGLKGERSSLIIEAIRLVAEYRPSVFIWENVKGAFSSNGGADFAAILQAFTNIGGYRLEWQLLNTRWLLPQNRERIYLIGHLAGTSRPKVFPIREKDFLFSESKINAEKQIASCLLSQGNGHIANGEYKGMNLIQIKSATKQGYELAGIGDSISLKYPNSETRRGRVGKGVSQTLQTNSEQGVLIPKPEPYTMGDSKNSIRRLTEIEYERLQGFPDNWTKYGDYNGQIRQVSGTQRYKMCGNAVTVDIIELIGNKMLE